MNDGGEQAPAMATISLPVRDPRVAADADGNAVAGAGAAKGRPKKFPHQLYALLEFATADPTRSRAASWFPDGRSFVVGDREGLTRLLPMFSRQSKWSSFNRQLNLWGFDRIDTQTWSHPNFIRGEGSRLDRIVYIKVKGGSKADGPKKAMRIRIKHTQRAYDRARTMTETGPRPIQFPLGQHVDPGPATGPIHSGRVAPESLIASPAAIAVPYQQGEQPGAFLSGHAAVAACLSDASALGRRVNFGLAAGPNDSGIEALLAPSAVVAAPRHQAAQSETCVASRAASLGDASTVVPPDDGSGSDPRASMAGVYSPVHRRRGLSEQDDVLRNIADALVTLSGRTPTFEDMRQTIIDRM